ncbi:RtcB family protein [Coraliomargarita sp. SDUM461003]|uniref:3'-phosphate/5'-hydroxy nucleic acid ligase n=1 Tax=Thalassobacterium maritimum TaxID=3041265 RepID=A0ABU1AX91_9BACT|nr:RtcB family protein [Coraliomargarita sp. SDUM461003]MDQ8207879.1 RtcB family protein [Coraliomargarita sp. SDUM461003]
MNSKKLLELGVPHGDPMQIAFETIKERIASGVDSETVLSTLTSVVSNASAYADDVAWGAFARSIGDNLFIPRANPAPWQQWGVDLEPNSVQQMVNACDLPVAVAGALMPDAHLGYGLPIGGVLATDQVVIPFAVGVDIACRMKMTVLDIPVSDLDDPVARERLIHALETETRFGIGANFKSRGSRKRQHGVLDLDWDVSPVTKRNKDKAWAQLGTSGSGNHFVEYGVFEVADDRLGLAPGNYLALLSHSGSRGTGASVADHYSKLARQRHPELPKELSHLAWLDMDSAEGQEYWAAMNLMGEYAAANHWCIHHHIAKHLGAEVLFDLENHHNFAWKERHLDRDVIVHRKGATPAGKGVLGIIPGSMATPAYIVRGKGVAASLNSASHGAGRVMSRKKAKENLDWKVAQALLKQNDVTLLSAGIDEVPMVYKNIETVMNAQDDLVEKMGRFHPRIVKMAPAGERPED